LALAPIVAAMAAGCTVVLKPSELTVNSSGLLAELLGKAFNPAYLSVVLGGVSETTELLEQRFDMIFFTGSVPVGKIVYQAAAKHLTPVVLELGGKSPVIIGPDADLEITVKRLVWAKFLNAGQTCIAPDYVCVHASIADEFIAKLKREIESAAYCVDDDSLVQIVNKRNTERLVKLIDPAKVILGGKWNIDERVIEPTVMAGVAWDDKVMQEEIFGPLLPIMTYTNIDKIISEIKARPKPLSLYLFTRDEALKEKILVEISFGGGCVNEAVMHIANGHLPFGGVGDSGIGSYHGEQGFRSFSHFKSVFEKQLVPDPDVKYTPHTAEKLAMLRQITTA
jgi:aldehyde dehydrogenase (NAD+)